jgi:type VI secretion system protein ImpG
VDPRLLEYYTSELLYMRELAGEFAQAHPKIAPAPGHAGG